MNQESRIAFMPIKPVFVEQIVKGRKSYEFRRAPIRNDLTHIIIYASSPVKEIIGVAEVGEVVSSSPNKIWEKTKQYSGISRSIYREYFRGKNIAYAIHLKKMHIFQNGINVETIEEDFNIPQSFSYVQENFLERVLAIGKRQFLHD